MNSVDNSIKVSVIIPIYNSEKYLKQCLECVKNQTFTEIEVLCVNDGSTDGSLEIMQAFCEEDSRFRILHNVNKVGKGAGSARNYGLKNAKGKYILWLDADDWFDLDLIETVYNAAEEHSTEIVLFDAIRYDVNTGAETPYYSINYSVIPKDIVVFTGDDILPGMFQFSGAVWNKLFLRSYVEEKGILCQEVYFTDDVYFAFTAMMNAKRMILIDKKMVHYRWKQSDSQLTNRLRYIETMYAAPMAILEEVKKLNKYDVCKNSYIRRWIPHMMEALVSREDFFEYKERFDILHKLFLEEIDVSSINENDTSYPWDSWWLNECRLIAKFSFEEFLFIKNKMQSRKVGRLYLPKELCEGKNLNIAIYGAGDYGKKIYSKLNSDDKYKSVKVKLWVDKSFDMIGYPVKNPESLIDLDVDYVLISIVNSTVVDDVKNYLEKLGINNEKIISLCNHF